MNTLFLATLGAVLVALLGWGFKYLPGERWQMLAVVPLKKAGDSSWHGANLTYYGFFVATSQLIAIGVLLVLLGSIRVPLTDIGWVVALILLFSVPAARLVAIAVEKKRHTFTIGGASFVGILVAPWCIEAVSHLSVSMPGTNTLPVLAALSVAYTLGEGLGRLGCLSFGCCYGKALKDCSPFIQWLFQRTGLIFYGKMKKVSYEAQLEGERLIPIQALTSIVYTAGAFWGAHLFLQSYYTYALIFTISLTQLWRIFSETLRADFRGFSKISAYQKMGLFSVLYTLFIIPFLQNAGDRLPDITLGFQLVWQPGVIILSQLLWLVFFVMFGRSTITGANISFTLSKNRI
jgi:hypothetical protein